MVTANLQLFFHRRSPEALRKNFEKPVHLWKVDRIKQRKKNQIIIKSLIDLAPEGA